LIELQVIRSSKTLSFAGYPIGEEHREIVEKVASEEYDARPGTKLVRIFAKYIRNKRGRHSQGISGSAQLPE
jgi:hypothetical protein